MAVHLEDPGVTGPDDGAVPRSHAPAPPPGLGRPRRPGRAAGRHADVPRGRGEPRLGRDAGRAVPAAGCTVPDPGDPLERRGGRGRGARRRADPDRRRPAPAQPDRLDRRDRRARRERVLPPGQGPRPGRGRDTGGTGWLAGRPGPVLHRSARAARAAPRHRAGDRRRGDHPALRAARDLVQRAGPDRPGRALGGRQGRRQDGGRARQRPAAARPVRGGVPALGGGPASGSACCWSCCARWPRAGGWSATLARRPRSWSRARTRWPTSPPGTTGSPPATAPRWSRTGSPVRWPSVPATRSARRPAGPARSRRSSTRPPGRGGSRR